MAVMLKYLELGQEHSHPPILRCVQRAMWPPEPAEGALPGHRKQGFISRISIKPDPKSLWSVSALHREEEAASMALPACKVTATATGFSTNAAKGVKMGNARLSARKTHLHASAFSSTAAARANGALAAPAGRLKWHPHRHFCSDCWD